MVAGERSTNKQLTERMIGNWLFAYTIISRWEDAYSFPGPAVPSTTTAGEYVMFGTDKYGDAVITTYEVEDGTTTLFDPGIIIDQFYVYNFQSAGSVSGCYYQIDLSTGQFSPCYPLQGTRLSTATSVLGAIEPQVETGQWDIEARLLDEVEAQELARASLSTSSVESPEAIGDRISAQEAYRHLREAYQAR